MKVTVRTHTPSGLTFKKYKVSSDGKHLLMRKETKKKAGWNPLIGTMEVKHKWFGRTSYYTDIFPEAEQTWTVDYGQKAVDAPKWDKAQSKKFIEAKMVEKTGQETKEKHSGILWVIAILGIANIVITLISSGRIRIG
ncbi:hypothetical protein MUP77_16160 [Candidatus Bathyarchaeota archaeon]|nr:hypothetical protein [Candidatus Bathyarchaeota archaeon]